MFLARILYPIKVLGPGKRIGIWFDGCEHHCSGCSNPELWDFDDKYKIDCEKVMYLINSIAKTNEVDGFTLTGGDPFFQPDALRELLPLIVNINDDILVYTGYQKEEIDKKYSDILEYISVLIDGKYVKEKNTGAFLRGSDNQCIYILKEEYKKDYQEYINHGTNEIQNFKTRDAVISVGIHRNDYEEKLNWITQRKGLTDE